jgi:hypothetical protein
MRSQKRKFESRSANFEGISDLSRDVEIRASVPATINPAARRVGTAVVDRLGDRLG